MVTRRRCLLLGIAAFVIASRVEPQGSAFQTGFPEISLKTTVATPGSEIRVPVYLDPGGAKVGGLRFRVRFPSAQLSFLKLEIASRGLEPAASASKAGLVPGQNGVLQVEMSNQEKPLPEGPLGWLSFHVASDSTVDELSLELVEPAAHSLSGDPIARVDASDTKVFLVDEAAAEALTSCFFYMH